MRELNENCVYSLEDLTSEEWELLKSHLPEKFNNVTLAEVQSTRNKNLCFSDGTWWHNSTFAKGIRANAKELFYTLENIQVDCRELSEEQIEIMKDVVVKNGYTLWDYKTAFKLSDTTYYFVKNNRDTDFLLSANSTDRYTITYEKFMELFAEPQYEVTEKPQHYSKGIDTFARMEANCTKEECLSFAKGNIDKYNWREKGQDLEDYKKIISYAQWAIKLLKDETTR